MLSLHFEGLHVDLGKAEDDIFFTDPPFIQLAEYAARYANDYNSFLDDIERACDSGVDGIILGSHGGRQADWAVAPLDILPRAREIVGDRLALYLTGGVRRGTDILKAKALGADVVLTGRAPLYGLCAFGADGVRCAIETLKGEMLNELGQYGIPGLKSLTADLLVRTHDLPL